MRPYASKTTTFLVVVAVALHGCSDPSEGSASPTEKAAHPASAKKIEEGRALFEAMAPVGWSLQDGADGIASYIVSIPQKSSKPNIGIISGGITLDGRNESIVKLGSAVPRYGHETEAERREALALYPDFKGYHKNVAVGSIAYDIKREKAKHAVAYYNFDKAISCYGHSPGQFRCYWGAPSKRMSLFFNADDLGVVLPYVLSLPGTN